MIRNFSYILIILLSGVAFSAGASSVSVKAKLDSLNLLMGRMTTLEVTVDQPKGVKGHFALFERPSETGVYPVCGDSVELRSPTSADTVASGNSLKITYKVLVQAFDSGFYRLPELAFVVGRDTVRSNQVALKVIPVGNVTKDTPIDDYAGVSDPEDASVFDSLPDWLYYYWWCILLGLVAIGAGIWLWIRYRKVGYVIPPKPEPLPYDVAIDALRQLKEKKLWEHGMEKEYFTELTEILRVYLYKRFGINAMEMTSRQILACLSRNPELKDKRPYFRQILDMADFVKFAKVRPLPEDNIASYDNAMRFVEETKPASEPEQMQDEAPKKGNAGAAAGKSKGNGKGKGKKGGER